MNNESVIWKIFHSLWALIAIIPFFGGFAFIYIGFRANERKWIWEGIIYLVPFTLALLVGNDAAIENIGVYLAIILWFVAIIRTVMLIKPYLERISSKQQEKQMARNTLNRRSYPNNVQQTDTVTREVQENTINYHHDDTSLGNDTVTGNVFEINKARREELSMIPGFDDETAEQIINLRNSGIYLDSLDDMIRKLDLKPQQIQSLKEYYDYKDEKTVKNPRKLDL